MTWKSTMAVSGVGLVATWLARVPPPAPVPSSAPSTVVAAASPIAATIAHEAERLSRYTQARESFDRPTRNPFRFERAARANTAEPAVERGERVADLPENPAPAVPEVRLAGVATDGVGEQAMHIAVLSTSAGVVLARVGEPVVDGWTVSEIDSERVVLVGADGTAVNLSLSGGLRP